LIEAHRAMHERMRDERMKENVGFHSVFIVPPHRMREIRRSHLSHSTPSFFSVYCCYYYYYYYYYTLTFVTIITATTITRHTIPTEMKKTHLHQAMESVGHDPFSIPHPQHP